MKQLTFARVCVLAAGLTAFASAAQYDLTLYTNTYPTSGVAGNGSTGAPGFGNESWQASAPVKSEVYIPMSLIFPNTVTIGDLASISYWTNKPGNAGSPDWTFYIYTPKTGSGDTGGFYHTRLNSEPYFTNTPNASAPSNTWHQWSTNDPTNPMRFYDAARAGAFGTYTDPTLADLQGGPINWDSYYAGYNTTNVDYRNEQISQISLQTGSAWGGSFTGLVDGITISLKNGDVATINLQAVPEPGSIVLLGTVAAVVGAALRKRLTTRS